MIKGEQSFYKGEVPKEEAERLKNFRYPDIVSTRYIPDDLTGKKFLDLGSGPNKTLEGVVNERSGFYISADRNLDFLKARQDGNSVQVNAVNLPFIDKGIDYAHSRFVMMHLNPEERKKVLSEMFRVSKENISLDYDWGSWENRITEAEKKNKGDLAINLQRRFFENSKKMAEAAKIELNVGNILEKDIEEVLGIKPETERIVRPEGDYYNELVELGSMTAMMWRKFKQEDNAKEMEEVIKEIKNLSTEQHTPFSPPDVVANTF